jgi:hypothetical protein
MTAGAAHAQGAPPPGLVILEQSWERGRPPSPALYEDPLNVAADQARLQNAQKQTIQQNKIREKANVEQLPVPQDTLGNTDQRRSDGYVYTYTARVRNDGGKKIRRVVWDYLVFDSVAGREVGRHRFTSKVGVPAGQTKKLQGRSTSLPSDVINASAGADGAPARYSERVVIRQVEYEDGSVWEGASN